jgi:fluoride exporter
MKTVLFVGFGGALGSMLRYLLSLFNLKYFPQQLILSTFLSNLIGCLLIGLFMGNFQKQSQSSISAWQVFLVTGFCGGFTTFSAFAFENFTFIQHNHFNSSIIYIGATIILCLLAVWIGISIML